MRASMSESDPANERKDPADDDTPALPSLSASRVDKMTEEFARLLSRREQRIGEILGNRYRITGRLGDGGMGQVFAAESLSIGNRVAIKVLKAELLADAAFRQRFQHEAEAIAAVEHQNVVRFFDLVVGDPTFLVMEYLRGTTLAETLKKETRLPLARAIDIVRRLCFGLDAVHRAGVVHRDIKPSNVIMVSNPDGGEEPKLIDFGVAKVAARPAEQQLTVAGQLVGTPHYMSPEQINGEAVDARADIYSLGCLLYHLAAGHPPFRAVDEFKILTKHVNEEATPLSHMLETAPPELDRVLARALAKLPADRFASMREMAEALSGILPLVDPQARSYETTAAGRPSALARRPTDRHRSTPLVAVAVLAALGGFAGGWSLTHRRQAVAAAATTAHNGGVLMVASDPEGAAIELDGARVSETTPAALPAVARGRHQLVLRLGRHPPLTRTIELGDGERALVQVTMPPSSHPVEIASSPGAARVYLDGKPVDGVTPVTVQIIDDDLHELRVEKLGFETVTYTIAPEDHDATKNFNLVPETRPHGQLTVNADVNAEVWIDGVDSGFSTPTLPIVVNVGAHRVEVRAADGNHAVRPIHVRRGETMQVAFTLASSAARPKSQ
jgi:tRNA A-37 threonylcarbamoyl transferase component Bud32